MTIATPMKARSRLARAVRDKLPPEAVAERRADLVEANIAAAIQRALADAPALDDERAERLAALLKGD
jgi:hypothetical protein